MIHVAPPTGDRGLKHEHCTVAVLQFMENWCYDRNTLYSFAKHFETGEPLPEDMFRK